MKNLLRSWWRRLARFWDCLLEWKDAHFDWLDLEAAFAVSGETRQPWKRPPLRLEIDRLEERWMPATNTCPPSQNVGRFLTRM